MFDIFYISPFRGWSDTSMVFYEFLALLGFLCFYYGRQQQSISSRLVDKPLKTPAYWVWIITWTFFATFRYVSYGIGGSDAQPYIMFFENCNNSFYSSWMDHVGDDLFFKYFNKFIRFFFDDYRVYFAIIYGITISIMVYFIDYFCPKLRYSAIPTILIFHLYLRSFNTIRSNLSFCLLLAAIILMANKQYRWMIVFAIASILTHKSMIIFAMFIPFYFIFTNYFELNLRNSLLLILLTSSLAGLIRIVTANFLGSVEFEGSYESYANKSVGTSFLDNYWKIAFEQIILGVVMFLKNSSYNKYLSSLDMETQRRVRLVWMMCIFDLLLIPIYFVLGIWRAAEYFHMARTCMCCVYIWIFFKPVQLSYISKIGLVLLLMLWIYNRVDHTWESSSLMPYLFSPFTY